ncbi:MFS transporter [Candidatus Pelagibacter sp.]|jgi:MFS family permease|nr:MFS transporter [Candidatus Pelagibacter sp.]|tara:strand:+ start:259 stop:1467 length:1209 start_codon:yes stop_codon:yes gene_type:complete
MINKTNKSILIFCVFAFGFFISNLLRSITATLTPILTTEFNLSAGNLGLLAGGYFIGFAIMQIPVGFLLDKHGPKKIISSFLVIAIIGTLSFALAKTFAGLLISRIFIGVGVSACMMGPLTGYRVWFAEKYQQRANSWMLMVANLGFVSSTLPVQILLPEIGWRSIFGLIAILTLLSIILILMFIPNWNKTDETLKKENLSALSEIWKNKFFISLIPIAFINYGGIQAIQTLWAGPWMLEVAGYNAIQSATGLFWINITMLIAFLFWGYILPKIESFGVDSIKIIKIGLPISYIVLFLIIYLGQKAGATLFALYILASIVISLTQPAIALTFAKNLAGKSLTSFNVFLFSGTFFMQWGIGLIIDFCGYLGLEKVYSYQISFFCFLILCIFSYLFFILKSKDA